jgi:hypothetical protein
MGDENNAWRTVKERCIARAFPVYGRPSPYRLHCASGAAIDVHPGSSCCFSTIHLDCCFYSHPNLGFSYVDPLALDTLILVAGSGVLEIDYYCQCCGSGSGIRCLFDPWIRDLGSGMGDKKRIRIQDPG